MLLKLQAQLLNPNIFSGFFPSGHETTHPRLGEDNAASQPEDCGELIVAPRVTVGLTNFGSARPADLDVVGFSRLGKQLLHVFDRDFSVLAEPLRLGLVRQKKEKGKMVSTAAVILHRRAGDEMSLNDTPGET